MKKFFAYLVFLLIIVFSLLYISKYDYILKGITKIYFKGHTTAYLSDYQAFSNHTVSVSLNPQPWPIHESYNKANVPNELANYHKEKKTVAFLIFKNDSIFHENYFEGYDLDSKSNSFSMVKSMVSAMLGKAIEEGYIKSLDQLVQDFIPELKGPYASQVTVGDLSSMASGLKWTEKYYSPFSVTSASYFVDDINTIDFRKSKTQLKNVLTYELSIIIWKYISGDAKNKIFKTGKYKTDMTEDEIAREKQYALQQDLTNENRLHEQVNNSWKESNVRQLDLVDYINHKSLEERVQQGIIDGDTSEEHIKDYTKLLGES